MGELLVVGGVGRCVASVKATAEALGWTVLTLSARVNSGAKKLAGENAFEKHAVEDGGRNAWR